MTPPPAAVAGPGLAGALVLGALAAPVVLLVAVVLVQALLVAGWSRTLQAPGAAGSAAVAASTALASDLLVLGAGDDRPLGAVPAVLALSVLAALGHQLLRRDGRGRLVFSLSATVSVSALAALAATYLAVEASDGGAALLAAAALPAGGVVTATALRRRASAPAWVDLVAVAVAAVASLVVPAVTDLEASTGLAVAAAAAVAAWVGGLAVARSARPDPATAAALPMALAGPVAYVLGRLLVG